MNTILLLEDEESLRRGIQFKLEREGYRCIACGSLKEGKALLGENDVQLVLCDITLTDGNGLSVHPAAVKKRPAIYFPDRHGFRDRHRHGL